MKIIIIIILFSIVGFSQTVDTVEVVNKIEKVRIEIVLNKTANKYIVRKVGKNYVVDLIREYTDENSEIAFEVLATDRTFDGVKYRLTKKEKDQLDGKEFNQ